MFPAGLRHAPRRLFRFICSAFAPILYALRQLLPKSVKVVEDAACAAGGALGDVPAGGLGEVGVFSFHPRKSITTGEGGMVTTHSDELAQRVRVTRNHGASISEEERHHGPQPYRLPAFDVLGFNYRMTDLQGAVGLVQLGKLDRFIDERAKWAAYYRRELSDLAWLRLPGESHYGRHAWQAFVTYVDPKTAPCPQRNHGEATCKGDRDPAWYACGPYARLLRRSFRSESRRFPGGPRLRLQYDGDTAPQSNERGRLSLRRRNAARVRLIS